MLVHSLMPKGDVFDITHSGYRMGHEKILFRVKTLLLLLEDNTITKEKFIELSKVLLFEY